MSRRAGLSAAAETCVCLVTPHICSGALRIGSAQFIGGKSKRRPTPGLGVFLGLCCSIFGKYVLPF